MEGLSPALFLVTSMDPAPWQRLTREAHAYQSLGVKHRVVGVERRLVAGRLAHQPLHVVERHLRTVRNVQRCVSQWYQKRPGDGRQGRVWRRARVGSGQRQREAPGQGSGRGQGGG